ncbi:MAG: glycine betaine ABC transporter substrate-binding protein [Geminicoccaceae bacterium]
MRKLTILIAALALVACDQTNDTLKVGGKNFSESEILSEMMAALAEAEGIVVTRRIGIGPTRLNLESLKRGEIDIYAEYNGTGLVMLGQPALADGDEAIEKVRGLYEPLGIAWGQRFGFANNYGLAMRPSRAEELGVAKISDLEAQAGDLTIGIDVDFQARPLDGYQPMTQRYGMSFGTVDVVTAEERATLYDKVLSGDADVIEVYTTDGQIAGLDLVVLEDDLGFFPVYEAAPLIRADALVRFPALRGALDQLAGKLDEATMQRLNSQVDQDALAPRAVARAALAEMGLISDAAALEITEPLVVATSPLSGSDAESGRALRAVREAFPGRRVLLEEIADPLAEVGSGSARIALVSTAEFADLDDNGAPSTRAFEAVGVVGQSYLHLIGLNDEIGAIGNVGSIATGPEGSASHRTALILAAGFDGLEIKPVDNGDLAGSGADAALLLAPLGNTEAKTLLESGRLISVAGWDQGNNLVRFPHLRQARIPSGTYDGQAAPVDTLSSQLVLAGPVVVNTDAVGPQGPGASAPTPVAALADDTINAIVQALDSEIGIDPAVPEAAVLAPSLPAPPAAVNPAPAVSALSVAVFALLAWLIWLYARPERR